MPKPIMLILFDAFDTLITPRIAPHRQYAEESRKFGIAISDEIMSTSFKSAFKEMTKKHPLYGIHSGLSSPNQWWTQLIQISLEKSGVAAEEVKKVMPNLAPSLLKRFSSMRAYRLAEGVPEVFEELIKIKKASHRRSRQRLLRWNIATNSDSRIIDVCREATFDKYFNLDMRANTIQEDCNPPTSIKLRKRAPSEEDFNPSPCLSYNLEYEKPDAIFFHKAIRQSYSKRHSTEMPLPAPSIMQLAAQTLYVGDHYTEDYLAARRAGLQAVWLKREQSWPDVVSEQERESILAIDSMLQVADIVRESWTFPSTDSSINF